MNPSPPDWLTGRGGTLKQSADGRTWAVLLGTQPHYLLAPIPVGGKYGCRVEQTNNGKRLEGPGIYTTPAEALKGGLEDLRNALGW
jgi:hypothetical protein